MRTMAHKLLDYAHAHADTHIYEHDDPADHGDEPPPDARMPDTADFPDDDDTDEAHNNDENSIPSTDEDGLAASDDDDTNAGADENTTEDETPTHGYGLRANRERNYSHRYDQQFLSLSEATDQLHHSPHDASQYIVGHLMTQMTASAGIKKYGDRATLALFEEFCHLDSKNVFEPAHARDLTPQQKRDALRAINLIKEKRCGKLKGRTCADGSSQRGQYTKEQTTSPTVSTDALMLSLMIDALEERDVATADVVGAYLLADMDEFVLIKLTGDAVDIMCKANAKYRPFVAMESGKKVLYLQLLKALYGCVRSALLWYDLFVSTLKEQGFTLNPYDLCTANKMIDGHQCTIVWYVDDNKISHVDEAVVSNVIALIEEKVGKMTVTRGKEHTFLGMKITFNKDKTVTIDMSDYIKEAIIDFGEDVSKSATSPATKSLFDVDDTAPVLEKVKADCFHRVAAKLLYICKRGRPDVPLPVAYLCTRVSCSTEEDWYKLKRVLQFLNRTITDHLVLGADCLTMLKTWVDAAYGVHQDMKSHTGGVMSLGRGAIMCKSTKQKLITNSTQRAPRRPK